MDSDQEIRNETNEEGEDDKEEVYDDLLDLDYFNDRELLAVIEGSLTPIQQRRYSEFRGQKFSDPKIKEIVSNVLPGVSVGQGCKTILAVSAKVFTGELIECAKQVQIEWNDKGALSPRHLREAYRRFQNKDKLHKPTENKFMF